MAFGDGGVCVGGAAAVTSLDPERLRFDHPYRGDAVMARISLSLAGLLIVSLAGCGGSSSTLGSPAGSVALFATAGSCAYPGLT
jgi:hypothetical protein